MPTISNKLNIITEGKLAKVIDLCLFTEVPQISTAVLSSQEDHETGLGGDRRASPSKIKQDVRRPHVNFIWKTRLEQASRYEEFSSSMETF